VQEVSNFHKYVVNKENLREKERDYPDKWSVCECTPSKLIGWIRFTVWSIKILQKRYLLLV